MAVNYRIGSLEVLFNLYTSGDSVNYRIGSLEDLKKSQMVEEFCELPNR